MNNQNLKVSLQEAKTIFIRSFYSINRSVLTFCENNRILFPEDQTIETYCHFMGSLLNDHFNPEESKDLVKIAETQIHEAAIKGCQLAVLLKKAETEYKKENTHHSYANGKGDMIKNHERLPANLAPHARKEILNKMDLIHQLSESEIMLAEYVIMTHWDTLETLESIIINSFGKKESSTNQFHTDTLSWFLNQQLPFALIDTAQKTGGSKENFLHVYQKELSTWLGWLIGFYTKIEHKTIEQQISEKLDFLRQLIKGCHATSMAH